MGLRIRTNLNSLIAQRHLVSTTEDLNKSMEKLSSGYRINRSADDAAGLAISDSLSAKIKSMEQARRNANDGVSLIQVAEGSMQEITNILIRLRELATQASSDTISNVERSFTNREYVQLVSEIDRIAKSAEFNNIKLLQGSEANNDLETLSIHVGIGDGSIENVDTITVPFEALRLDAEVLQLGTGAEIGPQDSADNFDREGAAGKLLVVDFALKTVASTRASLGAKQSRLNSAINNLGVQIESAYTTRSRIKDVDFASETANFTQQKILGTAGASVLSQANTQPELVLSLLR